MEQEAIEGLIGEYGGMAAVAFVFLIVEMLNKQVPITRSGV